METERARKQNTALVPFAKTLRRNLTREEKRLWYDFLRRFPVKFTRQKVLGKYIADFYCAQARIVLELDGDQHATDDAIRKDEERTAFLEDSFGVEVYRIPNGLIRKNFEGVCTFLEELVATRVGIAPEVLFQDTGIDR